MPEIDNALIYLFHGREEDTQLEKLFEKLKQELNLSEEEAHNEKSFRDRVLGEIEELIGAPESSFYSYMGRILKSIYGCQLGALDLTGAENYNLYLLHVILAKGLYEPGDEREKKLINILKILAGADKIYFEKKGNLRTADDIIEKYFKKLNDVVSRKILHEVEKLAEQKGYEELSEKIEKILEDISSRENPQPYYRCLCSKLYESSDSCPEEIRRELQDLLHIIDELKKKVQDDPAKKRRRTLTLLLALLLVLLLALSLFIHFARG